jgi:hypothetical protein
MSASEETINEGIDAPDTERVSAVHQARAGGQPSHDQQAAALIRLALDTLDDVRRLLQALAPAEIETAMTRVYLGNAGNESLAFCWQLYATRHRVLADLFASQHSAFAQAARTHLEHGSTEQRGSGR